MPSAHPLLTSSDQAAACGPSLPDDATPEVVPSDVDVKVAVVVPHSGQHVSAEQVAGPPSDLLLKEAASSEAPAANAGQLPLKQRVSDNIEDHTVPDLQQPLTESASAPGILPSGV